MKKYLLITLMCACLHPTQAQDILLDGAMRVGQLTVFPSVKDKLTYFYLPDKPQFALTSSGEKQFSFLRYAEGPDKGGAIIHALVTLSVSEEQLEEAEQKLKSKVSGASIKGPVMYVDGTVSIISSIAQADGTFGKSVIGIGKAPILEGQKAAISIHLNPEGGKLMLETFKTPASELSISYEMRVKGYRAPKQAKIKADFSKIYQNKDIEAAAASPVLSGELKATFDDLAVSGAIEVEQIGSDEYLESLVDIAYDKLTTLMFDRMSLDNPELSSDPSLLEKATRVVQEEDRNNRGNSLMVPVGEEEEPNKPKLAIMAAYKLKNKRQQGSFTIDLNKYTFEERVVRFDENLRAELTEDNLIEVRLDDVKERKVVAVLDGMNYARFSQYINFVNLKVRKNHQNGQQSIEELKINLDHFNQKGNSFQVYYPWKEDEDVDEWMKYEYQVTWNFFGGAVIKEEWISQDFATILLTPPFQMKQINFEADPSLCEAHGIRGIDIKLYYSVGEEKLSKNLRLSSRKKQLSGSVDLVFPKASDAFEYEVTWIGRNNFLRKSGRLTSDYRIVFLDQIPE